MPTVVSPPPPTPIEPVTEVLHGVPVTDPYRWLEDQNSPRTRKWLEEQSAYTDLYLDAIPGRDQIRKRVTEFLSIPLVAEPWNVGNRYFFLKRQADSEQPVIVMRNGLFGEETILVDPTSCGSGASTAVGITAVSQDGRFMAYSVRQGGTDYATVKILDIEQNAILPDRLPEGFCTGFAFAPDAKGFFYSHRDVSGPRPN